MLFASTTMFISSTFLRSASSAVGLFDDCPHQLWLYSVHVYLDEQDGVVLIDEAADIENGHSAAVAGIIAGIGLDHFYRDVVALPDSSEM